MNMEKFKTGKVVKVGDMRSKAYHGVYKKEKKHDNWLDHIPCDTICKANGKRGYKTRKKALGVVSMRRKLEGVESTPYKCPICGYWHLTTKEQWVKK